jgi:hypothetical protein
MAGMGAVAAVEPASLLSTPAEALAAARQGRLVIRMVAVNPEAAVRLIEDMSMGGAARVAVVSGRLDDTQAAALEVALPDRPGLVYAATSEQAREQGRGQARAGLMRLEAAYMLEVEPTERAFALLLARLGSERGVMVQLARSAEPVTTPGSVASLSWFRRPSDAWQARISAPVVIETFSAE